MPHPCWLSCSSALWLISFPWLASGAGACSAAAPAEPPLLVAEPDDQSASTAALSGSMPIGSKLRTTGNVNLRAGPSTSNSVLSVLPKGADVLTIHRTTAENAFWNVSHQGQEGWVHGNYLKLASSGGGGTTGEDWSCTTAGGGTQKSPTGTYYATSFGCWKDQNGNHHSDPGDNCVPYCIASLCNGMDGRTCEETIKWFAAGERRFGCGARLRVTNPANGKAVVVKVIDRGPNCSIEDTVDFWVTDLSYPTTTYLFGGSMSANEKKAVVVEEASASAPLGPVTGGAAGGSAGSTGAGGADGAGGGSGASGGAGVAAYATFHLNYTQTKDWQKCAERDFVVFDLLETSAADVAKCRGMGARMLCYFSSQYEDWRTDAGQFGKLGSSLDGWEGEKWVDPADPANLAVMMARLDTAASKGCDGIDLDNIDHAGHESYVMKIFDAARARGLLVSQKNAPDKIGLFWDKVDMYQNEQCQQYDECDAYKGLGRPVYNIEYGACKVLPYLYSNRKDLNAMNAWEGACSP